MAFCNCRNADWLNGEVVVISAQTSEQCYPHKWAVYLAGPHGHYGHHGHQAGNWRWSMVTNALTSGRVKELCLRL